MAFSVFEGSFIECPVSVKSVEVLVIVGISVGGRVG
jgi:hypothetical protein